MLYARFRKFASAAQSLHEQLPSAAALCGSMSAQAPAVQYPPAHQAIIPPPAAHSVNGWPEEGWRSDGVRDQPAMALRRIFCNRTLDLGGMQAIGFDMVRIRAPQLVLTVHNAAATSLAQTSASQLTVKLISACAC